MIFAFYDYNYVMAAILHLVIYPFERHIFGALSNTGTHYFFDKHGSPSKRFVTLDSKLMYGFRTRSGFSRFGINLVQTVFQM